MRISEIESKLKQNYGEIKILQKKVAELISQNATLSQEKESRLMELFSEYIQIGKLFEIEKYVYFDGIQTGGKEVTRNPHFAQGDIIEIIKKNKKSIVIKAVLQTVSKLESGIWKKTKEDTGLTFRIDINSIYINFMKNENFKTGFVSYVTRTESLKLLGIN
jgi:hypothetical protein